MIELFNDFGSMTMTNGLELKGFSIACLESGG